MESKKSLLIHKKNQGIKQLILGQKKFMKIIMVLLAYSYGGSEKNMVFATNVKTGWKIGGTMYATEVIEAANLYFIIC